MDRKKVERSHYYLRSKDLMTSLRPRTRSQQNQHDASNPDDHQEPSHQDDRNTTHQLRRRGRPRQHPAPQIQLNVANSDLHQESSNEHSRNAIHQQRTLTTELTTPQQLSSQQNQQSTGNSDSLQVPSTEHRSHSTHRRCRRHRNRQNTGNSDSHRARSSHRCRNSNHRHRRDVYVERRRHRRQRERASSTPAQSFVSNTPGAESDDVNCVICLDTVNDSEMKFIRCGHGFHKRCCNNWLNRSNACPVCRTVVVNRRPRIPRPDSVDDVPISDIIYFFTLSVISTDL